MIISLPLTSDVALGENRIIEPDDSQVSIPNTILPILNFQHVTLNPGNPTATDEQRDSTLLGRTIIRAPSLPQLDTQLLTLAKGLWELELMLTSIADFAATPANLAMVEVLMLYPLTGIVFHRLALVPNIIGGNTHYVNHRFLLNAPARLDLRTPATAVGQNVTGIVSLNCVRIL